MIPIPIFHWGVGPGFTSDSNAFWDSLFTWQGLAEFLAAMWIWMGPALALMALCWASEWLQDITSWGWDKVTGMKLIAGMAAGPLTCICLYVLWGWPQVFWGIPIWAVIVLAMYVYEEFLTGNRTERRRQQSMPFAPQDAIDEILGVTRDLSRARSREYQREVEEIARRHRKRKGK